MTEDRTVTEDMTETMTTPSTPSQIEAGSEAHSVLWLGDLDPCDGCDQPSRRVEPIDLGAGSRVWLCPSCRALHR